MFILPQSLSYHMQNHVMLDQAITTLNCSRQFADNIFKCIFFKETFYFLFQIAPKFIPKSAIGNKLALVQIMKKKKKPKKTHIHVVYGRGWSHWPTIPFLFGWYTSQTRLVIILYPAWDPATFCCFSRLRSYFRPTASSSWRGNALGFPKPQIMGSPWPP